jgi:hypothetical protein
MDDQPSESSNVQGDEEGNLCDLLRGDGRQMLVLPRKGDRVHIVKSDPKNREPPFAESC